MKSTPELILGFSCLQIYKISTCEILLKLNVLEFAGGRKLSKVCTDGSISEASFGPTEQKKSLKPLEICK